MLFHKEGFIACASDKYYLPIKVHIYVEFMGLRSRELHAYAQYQ